MRHAEATGTGWTGIRHRTEAGGGTNRAETTDAAGRATSWVESREDRRRGTDGVSSGRAGLVATTSGAPWLSTTRVECGADMGLLEE
jgi:hypothetical protein